MTNHSVATREDWLKQRLALLEAEKELTRHSDKVAELRRQLPWVRVNKDYMFEGPDGHQRLADLFDGRRQLIVQHFMFAPGWEQGCPSCSYMADHTDGMLAHLNARDTSFVAISCNTYDEIVRFKRRMGWGFKWLSSHGTSFNDDFRVSFTPAEVASGRIDYNYGQWQETGEEWPGVSVFMRDDSGAVFHTYSTYGRGVEVMMGTYRMLDLTPEGRGERKVPHKMEWVRHHDLYEDKAPAASCCHGQR